MPKTARTALAGTLVFGALLAIVYQSLLPHQSMPPPSPTTDAWLRLRQATLSDDSIQRYYTFQDIQSDSGKFANLVGWSGNLKISPVNPDPASRPFQMVAGRWHGKNAVRLDQVPLEAKPLAPSKKSFSVETWIMHHGMGMLPGGNAETGGTLLALGDGVWVGWRLTMYYPCNALVFEVGRPKPQRTLCVAALSRIAPDVWTHVACTWDGELVSLYVNGLLSGTVPYVGDFHPAKSHSKLRIGHVGNGLGSVQFDVDELAIYDRCLSPSEVLQHAWLEDSFEGTAQQQIAKADRLLLAKKCDEAINIYQQLSNNDRLSDNLRGLAKTRVAECFREQELYDQAYDQFSQIAESTNLSDTLRRPALLESLAIKQGVKNDSYRRIADDPQQDWIDSYELCPLNIDYDKAVAAYRHERSYDDADRWMQQFDTAIRPILHTHCIKCHSDKTAEAGLIWLSLKTAFPPVKPMKSGSRLPNKFTRPQCHLPSRQRCHVPIRIRLPFGPPLDQNMRSAKNLLRMRRNGGIPVTRSLAD